MNGIMFGQDNQQGIDVSLKTGNPGTPVDGHTLISGNMDYAADNNSKRFDNDHIHSSPDGGVGIKKNKSFPW